MLLFTSSDRKITGVDYDEEKIALANHNFSKTEHIQFVTADADTLTLTTSYECILLMDVLHYMPKEKQERVLQKCVDALTQNGILIIRDGMRDLIKKHKGTQLSEFFSTTVFQFNKTENNLYFPSSDEMKLFAQNNKLGFEIINETKISSNLIMVFRK